MTTSFDARTTRSLQSLGVDTDALARLSHSLRDGHAGPGRHRLTGVVAPPEAQDVIERPMSESETARLEKIGRAAIARGEIGILLLAGGMATRFGGVVKAEVEVVHGVSFLDAKVRDAARTARLSGGRVHVLAMTSFATHARVAKLLAPREGLGLVRAFEQNRSARLDANGALFLDETGEPSLYATGHGDLTFALRSSGTLDAFREAGGRHLLVSNVDNVGATLDPVLAGLHIERGTALTVEVVRKHAGDKGGAPARVDGAPRLVESFRFPVDFDESRIGVFNTNSIWVDTTTIDRDFPLEWHAVEKTVGAAKVIQFERLVGELTALLPTTYVIVPRDGHETRFLPVKEVSDLETQSEALRTVLEARGILAG